MSSERFIKKNRGFTPSKTKQQQAQSSVLVWSHSEVTFHFSASLIRLCGILIFIHWNSGTNLEWKEFYKFKTVLLFRHHHFRLTWYQHFFYITEHSLFFSLFFSSFFFFFSFSENVIQCCNTRYHKNSPLSSPNL